MEKRKKEIVNLTGKDITIIQDGNVKTIITSASLPKAEVIETEISFSVENEIPISCKKQVTYNLPEKVEGILLLVTRFVLDANKERDDLVCPEMAIKKDGQIIGTSGLMRIK